MSSAEVDDYLDGIGSPQRDTLLVVRQRLRTCLPDAQECFYYGVPAFKVDGKGVAGYAAAKRHCSYFPMSGAVLSEIRDKLEGYDWARGTLRFPIDTPLPLELIELLVTTRLGQIAGQSRTTEKKRT